MQRPEVSTEVSTEVSNAVICETIEIETGTIFEESPIHAELLYPECEQPCGAILFANPHPLLGGNCQNNVVQHITESCANNYIVLRFDYRQRADSGVDSSDNQVWDDSLFSFDQINADTNLENLSQFWNQSKDDQEESYREDLLRCFVWLKSHIPPDLPIHLIGYSFGCSLLPIVFESHDESNRTVGSLTLIAPTIGKHDYSSYKPIPSPKLIIAPQDDFVCSYQDILTWSQGLTGSNEIIQTCWDGHFFRGFENNLSATVLAYLRNFS